MVGQSSEPMRVAAEMTAGHASSEGKSPSAASESLSISGLSIKLPPIDHGLKAAIRTSSTSTLSQQTDRLHHSVGSKGELWPTKKNAIGLGGNFTGSGCCCATKKRKHKHAKPVKARTLRDDTTGPPVVLPLDPIINEDVLQLPVGAELEEAIREHSGRV